MNTHVPQIALIDNPDPLAQDHLFTVEEATLPVLRSIRETAAVFRRTPRTIRQWIADGHLRVIRIGRAVFITQDEINRVIGIDEDK